MFSEHPWCPVWAEGIFSISHAALFLGFAMHFLFRKIIINFCRAIIFWSCNARRPTPAKNIALRSPKLQKKWISKQRNFISGYAALLLLPCCIFSPSCFDIIFGFLGIWKNWRLFSVVYSVWFRSDCIERYY